jgi:hypothetical protein
MSYTVSSPGGTPRRPAVVTAASGLLYAAGAIHLAVVVLAFLTFPVVQEVVDRHPDTPEAGNVATTYRITTIVTIAILILMAAGAFAVAALLPRGRNPARIVAWVLGGIVVLCNVCGFVLNAASSSLASLGPTDNVSADIQREILDSVPTGQAVANAALTILLILVYAVAMILLALRPSNEFFRKEMEVWTPPTYPGGDYPPAPGQFDQYGQPPAPPGQNPQYPPPGQYPPQQ